MWWVPPEHNVRGKHIKYIEWRHKCSEFLYIFQHSIMFFFAENFHFSYFCCCFFSCEFVQWENDAGKRRARKQHNGRTRNSARKQFLSYNLIKSPFGWRDPNQSPCMLVGGKRKTFFFVNLITFSLSLFLFFVDIEDRKSESWLKPTESV